VKRVCAFCERMRSRCCGPLASHARPRTEHEFILHETRATAVSACNVILAKASCTGGASHEAV